MSKSIQEILMPDVINVLYISPNSFIGGAERVLYSLITGHKKYPLESGPTINPTVFLMQSGPLAQSLKEQNVAIYILKERMKFSRPFSVIRAIIELRRYLKEHKIDLIHSTMGYSQFFISLCFLGRKYKRVWFQHGPVGSIWDQFACLFSVDGLLFNSQFLMQDHFRKCRHVDLNLKSLVVDLGVEIDTSSNLNSTLIRKKYCAHQETIIFGSIGRINSAKGQDLFIKSAILLIQKNALSPQDIHFLIIGSPSERNDEIEFYKILKMIVKNAQKEQYFSFIDSQNPIAPWMKSLDCLVHTCKVPESFGLVVAESFLSETIVIGPSGGGLQEILKDQETGFVYNPNLPNSADILMHLMDNIYTNIKKGNLNLIKQIRAKAKQLIEKRYTNKNMVEAVEKFYAQIFNS